MKTGQIKIADLYSRIQYSESQADAFCLLGIDTRRRATEKNCRNPLCLKSLIILGCSAMHFLYYNAMMRVAHHACCDIYTSLTAPESPLHQVIISRNEKGESDR